MKSFKALVFSLPFFISISCFALGDTTITYYNYKWEPIKQGDALYIGMSWPENGKYRKQDFYYDTRSIQMDGTYADKALKLQDGVFTWYDRKGNMTDSCLYVSGLKQGIEEKWDADGNLTERWHWHHGLPVDTAFGLRKDRTIQFIQITDSSGNGIYQQRLADGKTLQVNGRLMNGKKQDKWIYRDSKGITGMEVMYKNDSVTSMVCYDEKGEPENKKDCILEQPAEYKGGPEAWRRFLEGNLRYPEIAQRNNYQGMVRVQFIIDKEGNTSEVKALESPHASLAAEAVRMIKKSGKWIPAVQYNRTVIYRHIQSITFRLQ